jgi:hypothetical protein
MTLTTPPTEVAIIGGGLAVSIAALYSLYRSI